MRNTELSSNFKKKHDAENWIIQEQTFICDIFRTPHCLDRNFSLQDLHLFTRHKMDLAVEHY